MKPTFLKCIAAVAAFAVITPQAAAQNALTAPAEKTIGVHKTEIVPSLIVMNADGGTLSGNTLTLTGIASNSIIFADRPVRSAGHALTTHLIEEWAEGSDSFAKDPPNATISIVNKDASDVEDAVVVLKNPKLDGTTLTFTVDVLESSITSVDGPVALFIDIIGLPRTPLSFAGVARRTAYRGAFYRGAALGAAAAAGAYAYPRPAYGYPPPPACGYYPYPPCY